MTYSVKILPRADREAMIKKHLASPQGEEDFYDFRSQKTKLKVIRVDINLPVYRMENFRTYTDQQEHIAKEKLDADYFLKGQELQTVQQQQHEILKRLSAKGPIIDVLEKDGQREPILISSTGVVINGNRRLAALRELGTEYVDCMVLPADATADEIVDIEANLQAKPETKLDYDWIGDAQLINRLIHMGRSTKDVADRLNRGENDIKNALQALAEADIYLRDWAAAPGEYSRVRDDAGQLFKDLPKLVAGKDQALQQGSRAIAWSLFENRDKLPGRIYAFNPAIGKLAADVLERLSEELDVPITAGFEEGNGGGFAIDFGEENEVNYTALIDRLQADATKDEAVDTLVEACQAAIDAQAGKNSTKAALKAITQAHSKLASVDVSTAAPNTRPGMLKQLESISALVTKLKDKINDSAKKPNGA
ncbi:ParB/RepB/Spo0J family partition protein [Mesorhizobium humile]|uniref:ParB/RepB/Spo0J family partition protein n=1 Tax=Mesorhizobium humile TaxID=3072313 RepID=A0ABU4YBU8_9HYPH|nr:MULTISPECIES: ParB/RepB/Spo0J family partition protein [unclassified Mesorhizobium]MDX8458391.1 ParB/RepB/Spo0J family partition protein [Mesorhizobium sp. VK2D]MDX8483803.1 ParB/RepB/Spo0J family partition protein [Mesorhizobium sp. VK2B]